jgi:PPOX class probable F420-dependent enzyme
VSRRAQIVFSGEEAAEFLEAERIVTCATLGRDGWPHLMPLWYVVRDGEPWATTYAKSQKVRNLERDPRCTLQVEAGDTYADLRGVMVKAEAELVRDAALVEELERAVFLRYHGREPDQQEAAGLVRQAPKRVALRFALGERASWDHRKLAAVRPT